MKIIAHRGASGYEPENTLASFKKALALDVDMIEFDARLAKSGELVVIHDETVDRTTDGCGRVDQLTLEKLRQLDAGGGEKIPLLSEVLDLVHRQVPVIIELKGPNTARPVAETIADYVATKGWQDSDFTVSSFNHAELQRFIKLRPTVTAGALFRAKPHHYGLLAERRGAASVHLSAAAVTNRSVDEVHKHGLNVYVYTVNEGAEARRMESLRVDGIFSDFPDRVAAPISHLV